MKSDRQAKLDRQSPPFQKPGADLSVVCAERVALSLLQGVASCCPLAPDRHIPVRQVLHENELTDIV